MEFLKPGPIAIRLGTKPETILTPDGGKVETKIRDTNWKPAWGQFSEVRNHYREAVWQLYGKDIEIHVRVFNDGIALRYQLVKAMEETGDRTGLNFAGDYTS